MMKTLVDLTIIDNFAVTPTCNMLLLESHKKLPTCQPGQFAQVLVTDSPSTLLRRPISICHATEHQLALLIRKAGPGTRALCALHEGDTLNVLLPLGHGWDIKGQSPLLVGGGVGIAPLYYLSRVMADDGIRPAFIIGAKTADELILTEAISDFADVSVCTDDGTEGFHGLVTDSPAWSGDYDSVYCCGPAPMMKAVSRLVGDKAQCQVSLENMMACGLGACLCCVERTVKGNVCVCTEGPVFHTSQLTW